MKRLLLLTIGLACVGFAHAGPPFATDDPAPTDTGGYEIYFYSEGARRVGDRSGDAGIDFNYGAAPGLQLTMVVPWNWDAPRGGERAAGIGNLELAAKYRFLDQPDAGVDVAFFPRLFLPAGDSRVGASHASLWLPFWVQRRWNDTWTSFGGGGCEINRGGDSKDFCVAGVATTAQVTERFQIGMELYHQGADTRGGRASTAVGIGATWDFDADLHLMASAGPGLQNTRTTERAVWYVALLWTP